MAPTPFTAEQIRAGRSTWADLQAHASFPAAVTTIEPETTDIPLGVHDHDGHQHLTYAGSAMTTRFSS